MLSHGSGPGRRFVGNLSPLGMLRGIVGTEVNPGGGGSGGTATIEVGSKGLNDAETLKKAVADLVSATNTLSQRERSGRVVTEDEWKNVDDGLKELSGKLKATEDQVRATTEMYTKGGETLVLDKALMRLDTPDDMAKSQRDYFNVVSLSFEELAGLSSMNERQRQRVGLTEKVARAYSSPGAARLRETQDRMQYLNDVLMVKDLLLAPSANLSGRMDLAARLQRMQGYKEWAQYKQAAEEFQRAFNEGTATAGLNWVPVVLSAQFMDLVQLELKVAGLFPQITMTSKTLDWPVLGGDLVAYLAAEGATDDQQTPTGAVAASTATLNKVTFTAQKLMVRSFASSEIIEDSIVAMVPFILANQAKVLARGVEDALINGESGGATLDGATFNVAGSAKRAWKGLRYYVFGNGGNTNPAKIDNAGANSIAGSKLMDVQLNMGVYGAAPNDLVWVVGFRSLKRIMTMTEMITLEKFGPSATIITGQVGKLFGSPVIVSEFLFDQKSTGVYGDGTARTFGTMLCVYKPAFGMASRRAININASNDRYIEQDQTVFVGSLRADFESFYQASGTAGTVQVVNGTPIGALYDIA